MFPPWILGRPGVVSETRPVRSFGEVARALARASRSFHALGRLVGLLRGLSTTEPVADVPDMTAIPIDLFKKLGPPGAATCRADSARHPTLDCSRARGSQGAGATEAELEQDAGAPDAAPNDAGPDAEPTDAGQPSDAGTTYKGMRDPSPSGVRPAR